MRRPRISRRGPVSDCTKEMAPGEKRLARSSLFLDLHGEEASCSVCAEENEVTAAREGGERGMKAKSRSSESFRSASRAASR